MTRALKTRVMPALHESYEDSRLLEDRFDYLGGQRLGRLMAGLRNDIPRVYLHSSWTEASVQMRDAVFQAIGQEDTPENILHDFRLFVEDIMQRYAHIEAIKEGRG